MRQAEKDAHGQRSSRKRPCAHGQTCKVEKYGHALIVRHIEKDGCVLIVRQVEKDGRALVVRRVKWKKTGACSWSDASSRKKRARAHSQTCEVEKDGHVFMVR
jgi:hypothetical protein